MMMLMSLSFKIHLINDNLEKKNKHMSLDYQDLFNQANQSGQGEPELNHQPTHYPL